MLRKRIKKKKPLKLLTKQNKLHSKISKSTYFYTNDGDFSEGSCHDIFVNRFWVRLSSLRDNSRFPEAPSAIPTRRSLSITNLYGKNAHGRLGLFRSYLLPVVCSMALLLVFGWMVNPFAQGGGEAYAAINEDLGNGSTISLTIMNNGSEVGDNDTVSTEVQSGQVSYISNSIKVTTNKISKYYVGVQSATNSSDLTGSSTGTTITGVGSNVSTSSFGDNTWGYALTDNTAMSDENLTYSTLPSYSASTSPQYASAQNPANGEHELKLTFAAKIRADKPADHYQAAALISVAAEAKAVTTWGEYNITQMQQMTSSICTAAQDGTTGQLTDKRDNKTYWVTKLKDGNCWMTQNLAIIDETITSADSDITSGSFTIPVSNISGFTISDRYQSKAYYDETYGGYYNWFTATAGSGNASVTTEDSNASDSICPKGWKLPPSTGSGSYHTLFTSYGTYQSNTLFYGTQSIVASPLNFVYGGSINNDSIQLVGSSGYYWSSTAVDATRAYPLSFSSTKVTPFYTDSRTPGYSVRCVAR